MITKLSIKNYIDLLELVQRVKDLDEDFYITENRERKFINNEIIIKKILKKHECYGIYDGDLKGIAVKINDKGFRSYIKFLSFYEKISNKLIQYILWKSDKDIFIKIKKDNKILKYLKNFEILGDRGKEILLKGIK